MVLDDDGVVWLVAGSTGSLFCGRYVARFVFSLLLFLLLLYNMP